MNFNPAGNRFEYYESTVTPRFWVLVLCEARFDWCDPPTDTRIDHSVRLLAELLIAVCLRNLGCPCCGGEGEGRFTFRKR